MNQEEIDMNNRLQMIELVYKEIGQFRKISCILIMKKFKLSEDISQYICQKIWLRNHLEARKMAKDLEYRLS